MSLVQRIKELMHTHELSAAAFADKIGVQRSSISHILSERNKPSLDFVLKVLNAFPTVSSDWLLMGHQKEALFDKPDTVAAPPETSSTSNSNAISGTQTAKNQTTDTPRLSDQDVERVVVFYTNGTCSTYLNKK